MARKRKSAFDAMSVRDKIQIVDQIDVRFPRQTFIYKEIEKCHGKYFRNVAPGGIIIEGPRGAGKTWTMDRYVRDHQVFGKKDLGDRVVSTVRILHCRIFDDDDKLRVIERLLDALGDPNPTAGTKGNKQHRLFKKIKECDVEVIIFDEVIHLVRTDARVARDLITPVADFIKTVMNETMLPIVLIGSPGTGQLYKDEFIKDRFKAPIPLTEFRDKPEGRFKEFCRVLDEIDKALPFEKRSGLSRDRLARKLLKACYGSMRKLMDILRDAAEHALERGASCIEVEDLSAAWQMYRNGAPDLFKENATPMEEGPQCNVRVQ